MTDDLIQHGTRYLSVHSTWSPQMLVLLVCALLAGAGCGPDRTSTDEPAPTARDNHPAATGATVPGPGPVDGALRQELLDMQQRDQLVRAGEQVIADDGETLVMDDVDRENRLRLSQIFDEHGWPGRQLVGEDGSTAAWVIVQHADLDLTFQQRGLDLLAAAVAAGDASPGDLAYLTDRVLVALGEPQEYGTQWMLGDDGRWQPRTAIAEPDTVDDRRAEAGLAPLADYLDELRAATGS